MNAVKTSDVKAYYDEFVGQLLYDYLRMNRRVALQQEFFQSALPATAYSALVVGCGLGDTAVLLRQHLKGPVRAVDISSHSIDLAGRLFANEGISFAVADVVSDDMGGAWDVICLPDVFEHIPRELHSAVAENLRKAMGPTSTLLITVPSVSHQRALRARGGGGLQVVDEEISVEDLLWLANAVGGFLSYYSRISVFSHNDYAHVVIERGPDEEHVDKHRVVTRLKRNFHDDRFLGKVARRISREKSRWERYLRRQRVIRLLGKEALANAKRKLQERAKDTQ